MATAIIDGISTRYEVQGSGPPLLMYAPGGFNAVVEKWSTQGVYAKIKLLDHLPKKYTCIMFDRRECGQSGGRIERVTWDALRRAGQRTARPPGHRACTPHGRLHGVLPGGGLRRRSPADDAEHGALLARGRRQVPHQQPPAVRRASGLRAAAWPRRRGRAGRQGRQDLRRGSPRRAMGGGDQGTIPPSPSVRQAGHRHLQAHRRRHGAHHVRPRHRARRRARGSLAAGHSRAGHSRPAMPRTRPRPRATWKNACRGRDYWDVAVAEQTEATAPARIMEFLDRASGAS